MRSVVLSAAVLLGAASAGCAQQQDSPATASTGAPTSAAPTPATAADAPTLAEQIRAATTDRPTVTVALRTRATGAGQASLRIDGAVRTAPAARAGMDLTTTTTEDGKTETNRVIAVNRVFWVQQEGEEPAPGKSWLRLSRADIAALTDPAQAELRTTMQQAFDQLDRSTRDVSLTDDLALLEKGELTGTPATGTAGGTTVTRYSGTTRYAALAGEEKYAELDELGVTELTWEISVDADGLPTRFTSTVPLRTEKGTVRTDTVATYSRWGEPVTITAPPPAQVATLSELGG